MANFNPSNFSYLK